MTNNLRFMYDIVMSQSNVCVHKLRSGSDTDLQPCSGVVS